MTSKSHDIKVFFTFQSFTMFIEHDGILQVQVSGSLMKSSRHRGFIPCICGKPTETREPYLTLTYISLFTALRNKYSVTLLRSVSQ